MARKERIDVGGEVYHVINRANEQLQIFNNDGDYFAFEGILIEAAKKFQMRLLSHCIMPNHWHLVLWPRKDGDMRRFMQWITLTHAQRYRTHKNTVGMGHIYQGRYKSFLVSTESYLIRLLRYVERNALRAGLSQKAELWRWGSAWIRINGTEKHKQMLSDWPIDMPENYYKELNSSDKSDEAQEELSSIRDSINKGVPYGSQSWIEKIAQRFDLIINTKPRGRPHKS